VRTDKGKNTHAIRHPTDVSDKQQQKCKATTIATLSSQPSSAQQKEGKQQKMENM